jgi:hypothetical protein
LQCVTKTVQHFPVLLNILLKEFHDLRLKNIPDFQIGNRQFHLPAFRFSPLGQIPGGNFPATKRSISRFVAALGDSSINRFTTSLLLVLIQ